MYYCTGGSPILWSGNSLFSTKYHVGTRNPCYLRTYFSLMVLVPIIGPYQAQGIGNRIRNGILTVISYFINCGLTCLMAWNMNILNWFKFSWELMTESFCNREVISSQLFCNSCSCLSGTGELRKLSWKLSLLTSHQVSCNSCSCLTGTWELRKLSWKLSLLNSHVLVWLAHESWENSHGNSRFSTFIIGWLGL